MSYQQRKFEIIDLLEAKGGGCSMEALCKKMFVSRSTLRRDLIQMETEGIVCRYHGGISLVANSSTESSVMMRKMENPDKKSIIARHAKNYILDNMVIFMDSSSTVSYLCPFLRTYKNLTVITNGINIASLLSNASGVKVYICPGQLKNKSLSIIGEHSSNFIENFHADAFFLSCKAINATGIYEGDDTQALTKRSMIKNSDKKILLCDSTKEFTNGFFKLSGFKNINYIISNKNFSNNIMNSIHNCGTHFIC